MLLSLNLWSDSRVYTEATYKQILLNLVRHQRTPVPNNNQLPVFSGLVKTTNVDRTQFGEVLGKQVPSIIVRESKLVPAAREETLARSIKINKACIHLPV